MTVAINANEKEKAMKTVHRTKKNFKSKLSKPNLTLPKKKDVETPIAKKKEDFRTQGDGSLVDGQKHSPSQVKLVKE